MAIVCCCCVYPAPPRHALVCPRFTDWQARTPAVTRYTLFTLFGVGVVGFITGMSDAILLCPYQTVMSFQRKSL